MTYDHHKKAGNEGDCVKHPALIGALDTVLHGDKTLFHYMDVFAGHAWHPLMEGKEYEWKHGIGKLASAKLPDDAPNSVRCWRSMWQDSPEWPTSSSRYPGSSWIAAHRCRNAQRDIKLELYDTSEEVRRDLEQTFHASHANQKNSPNICLIGQSLNLLEYKQRHLDQADFVFIDPPGWHSRDPSNPKWKDIRDDILKPRGDKAQPTLMWMHAGGQERTPKMPGAFPWDQGSQGEQRNKCEQATQIGYSWTAVRWRKFSKSSGCILIYNCAEDAIREAVDYIVRISGKGWEKLDSSTYIG